MKAVVFERYGRLEGLRLTETERREPGQTEVLVRVHAAGVNRSDAMVVRGKPLVMRAMNGGLVKPKNRIPGADIAGRVEAVGSRATRFQPGDAVYGDLSAVGRGGFAEYVAVEESILAPMPKNVGFEDAAALPTVTVTALQALRSIAAASTDERVLIEGASGGVGTAAVQIAKAMGARVTAVVSTSNIDQAREIGADETVDYTRDDFAANGARYDVIYAVNGHHDVPEYRRVLADGGRFVMTGGTGKLMMRTMLAGKHFTFHSMKPNTSDLEAIGELVASGAVKPVIDRTFLLEETAEAMRYVDSGHARGKVVIQVVAE